ncbi:hypothetical protein [Actinomyces culturomici]|nr:hypothetical protein [Actinomyces culturomici]
MPIPHPTGAGGLGSRSEIRKDAGHVEPSMDRRSVPSIDAVPAVVA